MVWSTSRSEMLLFQGVNMEKISLSSSKVVATVLIEKLVKSYFKRSELSYLEIGDTVSISESRLFILTTIKFVNSRKMAGYVHLCRNEEARSWIPFDMVSHLMFFQSSMGVCFGNDPQTGAFVTQELK